MLLEKVWGKYLSLSSYCCFRNGKKHVLCLNPGAKPPHNCTGFKEILPTDSSEILYILDYVNELRDDVARGNISGWPTASAMNELTTSIELSYIARSMGAMCVDDLSDKEITSVHYGNTYTIISKDDVRVGDSLPRPVEVVVDEINKFRLNTTTKSILESFDPQKADYPIVGLLYDFLRWVGCTSNTRLADETNEERVQREKDGLSPLLDYKVICVAGPVEGLRKGASKSYQEGKPRSNCYWELEGLNTEYPNLCSSALTMPNRKQIVAALLGAMILTIDIHSIWQKFKNFFINRFLTRRNENHV